MLGNKRLVWPNQDWHHWQQLQAACTACLRAECVSVCLRLCVRVFVSVKMRWPDCSAEQWGKTRPRVVRIAPIKAPQETDHNAPRLAAPPLSESLCVFVRVPYPPTPQAMHTLALPLLTMPKQIWRWGMIHHWPCTAVSAPSYREVGRTKSCLKSLLSVLLERQR